MNQFLKAALGRSVLAYAMATAAVAADPGIARTPLGLEVSRGAAAANECSAREYPEIPAHYDACLSAAFATGHKQGGNPTGFDTGLYCNAWFAVDLKVTPHEKMGPAFKAPSSNAAAWKPLGIKYIKAYVEARKKAGLTDDQVLLIMLLDHDMFKPDMEEAERGN